MALCIVMSTTASCVFLGFFFIHRIDIGDQRQDRSGTQRATCPRCASRIPSSRTGTPRYSPAEPWIQSYSPAAVSSRYCVISSIFSVSSVTDKYSTMRFRLSIISRKSASACFAFVVDLQSNRLPPACANSEILCVPPLPPLVHRRIANAPLRHVDDPAQADIVVRIGDQAQISQNILDLFTIVELDAADDLIRDIRFDQNFLYHPRLGVRPVQNGVIAVTSCHCDLFLLISLGNEIAFFMLGIRLIQLDLTPPSLSVHKFLGLRPVLLAMTSLAAFRIFEVER